MPVAVHSPDQYARHPSAPIHPPPRAPLGVHEEAQLLYEATVRGLADVASGRKRPSEVVKTGCSIDLDEAYFEFPHDPDEIHAEDFIGIVMGLRDVDAGRTVPDEVVSAQFAEYSRRLMEKS
jgi:predicted transcriptional regulator